MYVYLLNFDLFHVSSARGCYVYVVCHKYEQCDTLKSCRGRDGERRMKTRCSTCIYID